MVKGISRQVIVVHSPDPKLFEEAIFILKDSVLQQGGVTDEQLLKEAKRIMGSAEHSGRTPLRYYGPVWAAAGAILTGAAWMISALL